MAARSRSGSRRPRRRLRPVARCRPAGLWPACRREYTRARRPTEVDRQRRPAPAGLASDVAGRQGPSTRGLARHGFSQRGPSQAHQGRLQGHNGIPHFNAGMAAHKYGFLKNRGGVTCDRFRPHWRGSTWGAPLHHAHGPNRWLTVSICQDRQRGHRECQVTDDAMPRHRSATARRRQSQLPRTAHRAGQPLGMMERRAPRRTPPVRPEAVTHNPAPTFLKPYLL